MSTAAVALIVVFISSALVIRALSVMVQRPDSNIATERVRIFGDTPYRAMMDE
ncbi:hypothetical protein [Nocardia anaemiae]|uniref:hypothetical protein n=1 Tax=Nocardia anaemiae TaxID=263910 RepID=UPI000AEEAC06|nr:hypothetical protein [Nocardia anaemiae]